ncbi:MAG: tRNA 2-thiouridine(34) synthase MnmA [Candidatus Margulisbacteria bacterium]|nr:tRNA 2-thiouridine(34) synthase MnmA [Candidatus Margulisiibacteriota bacterium]
MSKGKVLVAMSGGVDSSVTAALLQDEGYKVSGVYMNVWDETDKRVTNISKTCYGPGKDKEAQEARRIGKLLDIPITSINLNPEFTECVLSYFTSEYHQGRTPNPCVVCNQKIKFGALIQKARECGLEFDYFATGHYAKTYFDKKRTRYILQRAQDLKKDQSYFLYRLNQEQLKILLFPLGDYLKADVKKLAVKYGLGLEQKKESQNFVDGDYSYLLGETSGAGDFILEDGKVVGRHKGIEFYTIGQRRGLVISAKEPFYVLRIDKNSNQVVLGKEADLSKKELTAGDINLIAIDSLKQEISVSARIRYASELSSAKIIPLENNRVKVIFEKPQKAITPGQSVVFYDGDVVVGGGVIE